MEYKDPGRYIPIIYLLYSWGSRFGVPSKVPLAMGHKRDLVSMMGLGPGLEAGERQGERGKG